MTNTTLDTDGDRLPAVFIVAVMLLAIVVSATVTLALVASLHVA
jgi:hypothetical protein